MQKTGVRMKKNGHMMTQDGYFNKTRISYNDCVKFSPIFLKLSEIGTGNTIAPISRHK
jgi:hypothetical protein